MAYPNSDLDPELYDDPRRPPLSDPSEPARIPGPSANDKTPPLTLRGIPTPKEPSDLDKHSGIPAPNLRGILPQHEAIGNEQAEVERLRSTGSGISQIKNPIGRGLLQGLDIIGSIASPGLMARIPGTEFHHRSLLNQADKNLSGDIANEEKEAQATKDVAAANSADRNDALNRALLTKGYSLGTDVNGQPMLNEIPGFRVTGTPDEQTFASLLKETNPDTSKLYTPFEAHQKLGAGNAEVKKPPIGDVPAKQYNDSILRELNINPKTAQKVIPPEYEVKATDTDAVAKEKFQRAKDLVSGATGQQRIVIGEGNQSTNRMDKSYDKAAKRLDDARKPVDDAVQRMGRLQDTLNQKNPQADALVAPELLTVMAGGQGSGLRMNEAEIARIVGGRSAWENLKASLQHWSLKPEDARSITPEQDKQIRALVEVVHQKLLQKQKVLTDAEDQLLDAQDVQSHRRIVNDTRQKLDSIDAVQGDMNQGGGGSQKVLSRAAIQKAAKDHGKTEAEVEQQAKAQGYTIK